MSCTILRPTRMLESSSDGSHRVEPGEVYLAQGDHLRGHVSRAAVGALAAEAIFLDSAHGVVTEVASSSSIPGYKACRRAPKQGEAPAGTLQTPNPTP
ncbi:hypothetical protein T484DRAFT_2975116 [Baffinella frigidus]|nr:hypothetical protein T484DRAFT_2975116 [Cryptophyta sp. CCMP2293]